MNPMLQSWFTTIRLLARLSRQFNTALDTVFYDVGALDLGERTAVSGYSRPEGSVIVVHPKRSKQGIECLSPLEFAQGHEAGTYRNVDSIAVPGVGSSALGAAALARNIADYLGRPVAGIVAGYGVSDLLSEAIGGWFVLGFRNTVRDQLARWFDLYGLKDHVREQRAHESIKGHLEAIGVDVDRYIYGSPDSAAVLYLISKLGTKIKLVVGHSKGNLSIENALEGLLTSRRNTGTPSVLDLTILTMGAVIRFPPGFENVFQYIGRIDYFGFMNSRPFLKRIVVPNACHSLNRKVPFHMPVRKILESTALP